MIGGNSSKSGIAVNDKSAMSMAAVWSCVRLISESVSSLPFHVYEKETDSVSLADNHPLEKLISLSPNQMMTSIAFREAMMVSLLLNGNAYCLIVREGGDGGRPVELKFFECSDVLVTEVNDNLYYRFKGIDGPINSSNVIHVKGISYDGKIGISPIQAAKDSIGLGLAVEQFSSSFYKNGSNMGGVITVPSNANDLVRRQVREDFANSTTGINNSHKTHLLPSGVEYKPIGIAPQDAEFIATRKFSIAEISRIYRVPLHMISELDKSSFNNIEEQSSEYVKYTLLPWVKRIEQEFNKKLFREAELSKYFVRFNLEGLLRGNIKVRSEYYTKMIQNGVLSPNEVRALENMNKRDGGDEYLTPLNMSSNKENKNEK